MMMMLTIWVMITDGDHGDGMMLMMMMMAIMMMVIDRNTAYHEHLFLP